MDPQENRRHKRIPLVMPICGKCLQKMFQGTPFRGETLDLSYGGLRIKTRGDGAFRAGQKIKFRTRLYKGDFLLKGQGVVCWVNGRKVPGASAVMGVRLTRIRHYSTWCERVERGLLSAPGAPRKPVSS